MENNENQKKALTWGDVAGKSAQLAGKVFHCVYFPGILYACTAENRARKARVKTKLVGECSSDDNIPLIKMTLGIGAVGAFVGGVLSPLPSEMGGTVSGAVVGFVALPWIVYNGLGVADGAYNDARTISRKVSQTDLYRKAGEAREEIGEKINAFAKTPVRETLRLKRRDHSPKNNI